MKKIFKIVAGTLLMSSLLQPAQAMEDQSGVVLSFDDTYVDQWYDYFSQSAVSDVKATFFVSHWHTLTAAQVNKLKLLEAAGHEIGGHTYNHRGVASTYNLDPAQIDTYLNEQIIPSLQNMKADGFNPVSFSYPFGERNTAYDAAVRQHFPYLRTTFASESSDLFQMDEIFHSAEKRYDVLAGDGIDNQYNNPVAEIDGAFLRAKTNNEIVTLYAHRIVSDTASDANHNFAIRVSKLNQVIAKAREMGLKFYTFQEAYRLGNQAANNSGTASTAATANIEVELEGNRVRLKWTDLANDFIGIVPVGQNAWADGMAGVGTDGSPSGKIGINIPVDTADQQYIAIFYTGTTEVGRSASFTVSGSNTTTTATPAPAASPAVTPAPAATANPANTGAANENVEVTLEGNRIRVKWTGLANDFIGIVPVGQNAWAEGMEGATTDGSASGKIGINAPADAAGQQYTAIFYSAGTEVGRSPVFTVAGDGSNSGVPTPASSATPTPELSPSPVATATPEPAPTVTPAPNPTAEPAPTPVATATATPAPAPTVTPAPASTAEPAPTPVATATPAPVPTVTPTPAAASATSVPTLLVGPSASINTNGGGGSSDLPWLLAVLCLLGFRQLHQRYYAPISR